MPGSANFRILKKNHLAVFLLNEECPKLLSGLGINHRRRKTISPWNSTGKMSFSGHHTICLVSTILGTV